MFGTKFKPYFLFFICLLNLNLAKAQLGKEAWHWQFGLYGCLDFSSGIPVSGYDSIDVIEGSASISDKTTGQLLFYSDGSTAWDKNGHEMINGTGMIGGHGTSTQAALIVPKPNNSNIYYLISADQGGYIGTNQGVHYSIIDMSLNGGLGKVTIKNILLTPPPTTEKLTAVKHCNDRDYWIITHPFNSNAFNVYLVTPLGIDTIPIISNVGTTQANISHLYYETAGCLKASPNGKKLACAIEEMQLLEIFDFDNSTGVVSNPISLTDNPKTFYPYGVSFSPDNSKLYTLATDSFLPAYTANLYQYDISSGTALGINSSRIRIPFNCTGCYFSASLQIASDGKIYFPNRGNYSLSAINQPNISGLGCNLNNGAVGTYPHRVFYGLPNFIDANIIDPIHKKTNIDLCTINSYSLSVNGVGNYNWNTGDTTKILGVNSFGNYSLSYLNSNGCKEIDTFSLTQVQPLAINKLQDTLICSNTFVPLVVNATDTNAVSFTWSDGYSSPIRTISVPGFYCVNYSFPNLCVSKDSFNFNEYSYPTPINFGDDTSYCKGKKELNASTTNCTYLWNTGETSSSIIATHADNYWVQVSNNGCKTIDSLIVFPDFSKFDFILPNIVTPNNDGINDFIDFSRYQFSSLQLEIYDRWGNNIFKSLSPDCIWKPTEDDGTYYCIVQYTINCGTETENKTLKSFITLAR